MASGESRGRTPAGWDESGIGALYALEDVRAYFVVRAAGGQERETPSACRACRHQSVRRAQSATRDKTQPGLISVPRVFFTRRALSDLERIIEFLEQEGPEFALVAGEEIIDATAILQRHLLIGRPVTRRLREPVISQGRCGHVARYRLMPQDDRIDILVIRHQRESGFSDSL